MKKLFSPWWAVITLVLMIAIRVSDPSFIESVRLRYFDQLITSKGQQTSQQVHVVNIDDETIRKNGQFPFPRGKYAALIDDLYSHGAGLVVFNIYLAESDRFGQDGSLVNTLKKYPVVLPQVATQESELVNSYKPFRPGVSVIGGDPEATGVRYVNIMPNIKSVNQTAAGIGVVNTLPEIDGVTRRIPMVVNSDGQLYPSISLETLRVASGDPSFQVKVSDIGIEAVRVPQFGKISTDQMGRIWVDWSSVPIEHSASRLPESFNGGIVIVGLTAKGLNNPVGTATGSVYPHYLQAAVLDTLISNTNISRPDYADGLEILTLIVLGILLITLSRWTYVGLAFTGITLIAIVPVTRILFSEFSTLVDATALLGGIVLVALHCYGIKFVSEFLQKQAIKKQFGGYASPAVVEMLQKNPELIKQGVKKEVSICFSDLRGFTPLGESFGDDVGGLTQVMNGYMDAITQPVLEANGMIIKYIGDASMHIHNAPIEDPNHPATAVATGLKMVKAVKEFSKTLEAKGRPGVKMGAGINTGLGYIGEMGSTARHSYDVLGDAVSTTARIESKCKEYGCVLLVGENTVKRCEDQFFFLKIDDLAVKGKSVGVGIYTVLDDVTAEYVSAKQTHNLMHESYRAQKFTDAIKLCEKLKGEFDGKMDGYYDMWIERCEFQKTQKLPKDWNGVFIATSK